ncbi:MAG TPA: VOC family protein [Acidimicrobiales bacterium]|jgi:catechol 2,3-dioxygenase-like lactoylglutathione lyase family enzyme
MAIQAMTHLAIRVRDLERSLCFYRDLLGFTENSRVDMVGAPSALLIGNPEARLSAVFLERDGVVVELQQLEGVSGHCEGVNLGYSHIGFRVTDLPLLLDAMRAAGADVLEDSRYQDETFGSEVIFVTDPDGARIELIAVPGDFDLWRAGLPS